MLINVVQGKYLITISVKEAEEIVKRLEKAKASGAPVIVLQGDEIETKK